jgi:formylglycine-generating enzyme required for sulfatase activity
MDAMTAPRQPARKRRIALFAAGVVCAAAAANAAEGPGTIFRDCPECPEMVVLPAGSFDMGDTTESGFPDELPVHRVILAKPFAIGRFEITFAQWDACVDGEGCNGYRPDDQGWGRGLQPVINVSWDDATAYVQWLSARTGKTYRLPSEAEWEYAARAGSKTNYPWGDDIEPSQARYDSDEGPVPVGRYAPNAFGLYDTVGNVWEWTGDCWSDDYQGAPTDGSARRRDAWWHRVLRGGSWAFPARYVRSASRDGEGTGARFEVYGFRVLRSLDEPSGR